MNHRLRTKNMFKLSFFLWLSLLFFIHSCNSAVKQEVTKDKPNIVFLFADDLTYTAINALGNSEIETPNLDRLVHNGVTFSNAYNMGAWNGAVCAASRAMMISGRYVWRADKFRKNWGKKDTIHYNQSWGKLMENAGYDTYMTGKWHVDVPATMVFQNVKHIRPGMPADYWRYRKKKNQPTEVVGPKIVDGEIVATADGMPVGYNRPLGEEDDSWSPVDPRFGGFWEGGKHWSEVLKDDALSFIDQAKASDNPFFMYLAFNAPHDPRQAPQSYMDKYPLDKISLPESWLALYPWKEAIGNGPGLRDEALAPFPRTEYATKVHIQEYYAIITHLDTQIGEILDALEKSGKMDNTYIFFTADHGLAVGRHGLLGKQSMYDHSIRPPLMMMGPNIPKGKTVEHDVYLQDIMATSLDLAKVEKPNYVEFKSFLPQAKGIQKEGNYKAIYGAYIKFQRMIRKDGFKLIVYPKINKLLLFDMKNDPEEIDNLADDPNQKEKVQALFKDLIHLQKEMEDELSLEEMYEQLYL